MREFLRHTDIDQPELAATARPVAVKQPPFRQAEGQGERRLHGDSGRRLAAVALQPYYVYLFALITRMNCSNCGRSFSR